MDTDTCADYVGDYVVGLEFLQASERINCHFWDDGKAHEGKKPFLFSSLDSSIEKEVVFFFVDPPQETLSVVPSPNIPALHLLLDRKDLVGIRLERSKMYRSSHQ